jgi:hypothetical protein
MKTTKLLVLTCAISINTVIAQESIESTSNSPHKEGSYLGQKPSGLIPELFAPDIIRNNDKTPTIDY